MSDETPEIVARSYTRGRRYPRVIGTITTGAGRFRLPGGPYSIPQFVTAAIGMVLLTQTRGLWGSGGIGDAIAIIVVPLAAGWVMRRARIEGREPHRAAIGLAKMLLAPASGRVNGRSIHASTIRVVQYRVRVAGLGGTQPAPAEDVIHAASPTPDLVSLMAVEPLNRPCHTVRDHELVAEDIPPQSALARLLSEQSEQIPA